MRENVNDKTSEMRGTGISLLLLLHVDIVRRVTVRGLVMNGDDYDYGGG